MTTYQINSKGETYITNPPRNQHGRIPTNYFENLILIYMIVKNERYKPSKFKEYVESLDILNDEDRELMPTRNYYIWKHHIDAAKQGLFQRQEILAKNPHRTFSIPDEKFNDAYIKISGYIEIMKQPKPKPKRKNINPNPKHTPNTTTSNPQSKHHNSPHNTETQQHINTETQKSNNQALPEQKPSFYLHSYLQIEDILSSFLLNA